MFQRKTLIASVLLGVIASSAFAAEQQQEQQQPRSGLGQQVAEPPPQVVYPRPTEVVEGVIGDIEDLQLTPE